MLPNNAIETIDGYRIRLLAEEPINAIRDQIARGEIDGIALNLPLGWSGAFPALPSNLGAKAFSITCPDPVPVSDDFLAQMNRAEMVLTTASTRKMRFESPTLRILRCEWNKHLEFGPLPALELLAIRNASAPALTAVVTAAPALRRVELRGGSYENLESIARLQALTSLEIAQARQLRRLHGFATGPRLTELFLENLPKLEGLPDVLSEMRTLRTLTLVGCPPLENFDFLDRMNLEHFVCLRTKVRVKAHPALARIPSVEL